jgi:hypothetical protein
MKARPIRDAIGRIPPLVKVGTCCGVLAGTAIGLMVSPMVGAVFGLSFGASAGMLAGLVMDADDKRATARTKKLDDIIGVTRGSLGTPSVMPPAPPADEAERRRELDAWVREWMTPPAPQVR